MRMYLRFLAARGECSPALVGAVPTAPGGGCASCPDMFAGDIERVSCRGVDAARRRPTHEGRSLRLHEARPTSVGWPGAPRYRRAERPDLACKTIFAHPFMVEELMRWLVADPNGMHEPVPADFD